MISQQRNERLRSKYPLLISSKNKLLFTSLRMLNAVFICEIFSFDAVLYFVCNLIMLSWYLPWSFLLASCFIRHFRLSDCPLLPFSLDNQDFAVFAENL
jgi:hypothetical protein